MHVLFIGQEGVRPIRKVLVGIIVLAIGGIIYSFVSLFFIYEKYQTSANVYKHLGDLHNQAVDQSKNQEKLESINDDYVGWINIDGTKIDYPVVQAEDNDYYLTRNFHRDDDFAGAIYMDFRNSSNPLQKHTIIYGHNMKDNSMFGSLADYNNLEFLKNNQIIELELSNKSYTWEILSSYVTNDVNWMTTDFTEKDYIAFLDEIETTSSLTQSIDLTEEDHILTLSTCTVNGTKTERNIVHARLINKTK